MQSIYNDSQKCYEIYLHEAAIESLFSTAIDSTNVFYIECDNLELLCNVLAVADQFLIGRLKDICETSIAQQCMWSHCILIALYLLTSV